MLQCQSRVNLLVVLLIVLVLSACERKEREGRPPPAEPPAVSSVCEQVSDDSVDGLPAKVAGYCLDSNTDVRRYGEGNASPLDGVCVELFNGECEIYKSYGLEGVKTTQYVSEKSARITVQVVASRFRSSDGAFGFFTRRILGDGLPNQVTVRPIKVEGRAAVGPGVLYLWRGTQVIELSYVSDFETPKEVETNSEPVLLGLGASIARGLLGRILPDVPVLIVEELIATPFSVLVRSDGILDVTGTGPFATGYSQDSNRMAHRLVVAERRDESAAKDLLNLVLRNVPHKKLKEHSAYRVRSSAEGRSPETWYFTQTENLLLAVAPLEKEQLPATSTPASRKLADSAWEKFALNRLVQLKAVATALIKQ